jgi:hypothetical protein
LAVLATLSASHSSKLIASGHSSAAALTSGYHLAFGIGAALIGCAILVALTVVAPAHDASTEIVADGPTIGEHAGSLEAG